MQITLELSKVESALLRALAPRGNARKGDYLQAYARELFTSAMKRESRLRRIGWDQVGAIALTEAAKARKERIT
jgi:hypothetical protein